MSIFCSILFTFLVCAVTPKPIVRIVGDVIYPSPEDDTIQCLTEQRVCIGNIFSARNTQHLLEEGITHIVSAIGEPTTRYNQFQYRILNMADEHWQQLDDFVVETDRFIDEALSGDTDARVLVHCAAGVSRSSSLLIYHLMETYGWSYSGALSNLKAIRDVVQPRHEFEIQLRQLEVKLKQKNEM